jgi:pentatricopeptide repeat protein
MITVSRAAFSRRGGDPARPSGAHADLAEDQQRQILSDVIGIDVSPPDTVMINFESLPTGLTDSCANVHGCQLQENGQLQGFGLAHFFSRRFDQAAEMLAMSTREGASATGYSTLASCYAHMGRLDEARAVVERLRAIAPNVMSSSVPYNQSGAA